MRLRSLIRRGYSCGINVENDVLLQVAVAGVLGVVLAVFGWRLGWGVTSLICLFRITALQWSYQSHHTSNSWAKDFRSCRGRKQSPVDISSKNAVFNSNLSRIRFRNYHLQPYGGWLMMNDGKALKLGADNFHSQNIPCVNLDGRKFCFEEVRLHWARPGVKGSEHSIDGEKYAAEVRKLQHLYSLNISSHSSK